MNKLCNHYRNSCTFFAKCCNYFYNCKRCHNENNEHEFICNEIKCDSCSVLQRFSQKCESCSLLFGTFCCEYCKLLDSTPDKFIFHCYKCGICRIGKREDYTHCDKCNCCLYNLYFNDHKCLDNRLKRNCPICLEYLDTSTGKIMILRCGHSLHEKCMIDSLNEDNYKCPICYKLIGSLDAFDEFIDLEIEMTPMPYDYKDKMVKVYCNECETKSETKFHILGLKCKNEKCRSYNTTQI